MAINKVFSGLYLFKLLLSKSEYALSLNSILILGYIVSYGGVKVYQGRISAV